MGTRERVSHVVRRLSMGTHPDVVERAADVDSAVAAALDLSAPAPPAPVMTPPAAVDPQADRSEIVTVIGSWIDSMRTSPRLIEERLVWFWHDHFATSFTKVRIPYLMWRQHQTIREHATGSFADLAHAITKDPAMLVYLDGTTNSVREVNENYGREFLELFTMGRDGGYTQDDVVAASHSFTGWVVNVPGRGRTVPGAAPWASAFVPGRWDPGQRTLLGRTGAFDADAAVDVVLSHPSTPRFVAAKLHRELVGLDPDPPLLDRLAARFASDWQVLPLVEAIVAAPPFASDAAVRAKVRTPLEKLVGLLQALPPRGGTPPRAYQVLRTLGYVPMAPPNVGGFPKGTSLATPHTLIHALDLVAALDGRPDPSATRDPDALLARFGLFDVGAATRDALATLSDPNQRVALVVGAPEYALT